MNKRKYIKHYVNIVNIMSLNIIKDPQWVSELM